MGANVDHDFEKGFLLGEEQLRKIHEIVNKRLMNLGADLLPIYRVSRGDAYSYTTQDIQDVVNEDNEDWRSISKLEVAATDPERLDLRLIFAKKSGVTLTITGDDRDSVFLLFSDLREYIRNEVLVLRPLNPTTGRIIALVLLTMVMLGVVYQLSASLAEMDPIELHKTIDSSDVLEKLNYLLRVREHNRPSPYFFFWFVAMGAILIAATTDWVQFAWNSIFPSNIFLFGKGKSSFEQRTKLRSNVFWVIGVGALVSIVAGLIVWKVTSP